MKNLFYFLLVGLLIFSCSKNTEPPVENLLYDGKSTYFFTDQNNFNLDSIGQEILWDTTRNEVVTESINIELTEDSIQFMLPAGWEVLGYAISKKTFVRNDFGHYSFDYLTDVLHVYPDGAMTNIRYRFNESNDSIYVEAINEVLEAGYASFSYQINFAGKLTE